MFKNINMLLAASAASVANRVYGAENIGRYLQRQKRGAHTSIATGNRHGGEHQHKREIARRARHAAH